MRKYSLEIAEAIKTHIKENDLHMVSFDEALGSFSFNIQLACQLSTNIIIRVGEDYFTTAVKACEEDSDELRAAAMKRARRAALLRELDSAATAAEASGSLPSFDEFVHMDSDPNAAPGSDSGEDNENGSE